MNYKPLFLFVEGSHDKEFFESIVTPRLTVSYSNITVKTTANNLAEVNKLTRIFDHQENDYWKINDLDESLCITRKKEAIRRKHPNISTSRILIVCIEIEGWYAAGLGDEAHIKLKTRFTKSPDEMTKEDFDKSIPPHYNNSKIAFMQDIIRHYSFDEARTRSTSFHYYMNKLGL